MRKKIIASRAGSIPFTTTDGEKITELRTVKELDKAAPSIIGKDFIEDGEKIGKVTGSFVNGLGELVIDVNFFKTPKKERFEVACKYTCDIVQEKGEHPSFGGYDQIQQNIGFTCIIADESSINCFAEV